MPIGANWQAAEVKTSGQTGVGSRLVVQVCEELPRMRALRIETAIQADGELHLTDLPCRRGDRVEVSLVFLEGGAEVARGATPADRKREAARQRLLARGELPLFSSAEPSLPCAPPPEHKPERIMGRATADFGIYWRNFTRERKQGDWPVTRWFTNAEWLARRIKPGGRLWLVTSGANCGMAEGKRGYLVQVFRVQAIGPNPGTAGDYAPGDFAYAISGDLSGCLAVDPPLCVDPIIRGANTNSSLPIGTVRQRPWKLKEPMAAALLECLRKERNDLFVEIAKKQ